MPQLSLRVKSQLKLSFERPLASIDLYFDKVTITKFLLHHYYLNNRSKLYLIKNSELCYNKVVRSKKYFA